MTNPHKERAGLHRVFRAARYSATRFQSAYRGEDALRQESWLAAMLLPLALIVELLNTAVEAAIDRISFEVHVLSKRAKDIGSAAVLLSLLLCAGTWCAALWQRFTV